MRKIVLNMLLLCLPLIAVAEAIEQDAPRASVVAVDSIIMGKDTFIFMQMADTVMEPQVIVLDNNKIPEQNNEEVAPKMPHRHEVRITAGDCMFENLVWHNQVHGDYSGCGDSKTVFYEKQKYHYTPHIDVEYHYLVNEWLSVGMDVDFQYTEWKTIGYGNTNVQRTLRKDNFYNLSILPSIRFTYARLPMFRMYSSIAVGLDINGGTELDLAGKKTAVGGALDMRVLGFAFGPENCMFTMDFGGLTALKNKQTMFMICSKIIQIGVACRF